MIEVLYETDELPKAVADKLDMDHSRACVDGHWVFSIISGDDSPRPHAHEASCDSERSFVVNIFACF